jgi:hypothetical protein
MNRQQPPAAPLAEFAERHGPQLAAHAESDGAAAWITRAVVDYCDESGGDQP